MSQPREKMHPAVIMASSGEVDNLTKYLKGGGDPNLQDGTGMTLLMWAAYNSFPEIISLLLTYETCDPNLYNERGYTALMFAIDSCNSECVRLICANSRTNKSIIEEHVNKMGHTPLKKAQELRDKTPFSDEKEKFQHIIKILEESIASKTVPRP